MNEFLNRPETREQLDTGAMLKTVEDFYQQCKHGEQLARDFSMPKLKKFDNIVICGMGGSAIGGDLIRAYASGHAPVPIEVVRNYSLPAYVDKKSLVLTGSYSGNTEETLSCYQEAKKRGAQIVAITTGGELAQRCLKDGAPFLQIPGGFAPRAALGYSFMPLLIFFETLEMLPFQAGDIKAMYRTLKSCIASYEYEVPCADNPAKQLAVCLGGKIPVIYAGQDAIEPIAARWRAQFNENTKSFAHNFVVPEMNHNEILGWTHPPAGVKKLQPVFLMDSGYHKQTKKRFAVMKTIFESSGVQVSEVQSQGTGLLARMMSLICLGDFVSVYLAYLYKQDPVPIPAIDLLKQELAK